MHRAAVQIAVPHASSPAVDKGIPLAEAAADFATGIHVQCIAPSVQTAGMRRKCPFSREKIGLSIAVTATNRNVLVAQTTDDRVGNIHDRDCSKAR
jgi:hypothetical protein